MRRAKLQPRTLVPVTRSPTDEETEDVRLPPRPGPLPPIGERLTVAPPPGKPDRPSYHRRTRSKAGVHHSKSQSQTSPDPPAAPTPAPPRGRDEPYLSYKDFINRKPSNTQQNLNFPDIQDRKGQASRRQFRIRPTNKDLTVINEIANEPARRPPEPIPYNGRTTHNMISLGRDKTLTAELITKDEIANEPARRPSEPIPFNGRTSRNMISLGRDRTPTAELSTENVHKDSKRRSPTSSVPAGHARLPPLEKMLKKRGNTRKNTLYD